ncbi:hypothetical protein FOZ63_024268, partial [Perkinsus olseni]
KIGLFVLRLIRSCPLDRIGFFAAWFALSRRFKPVRKMTWVWTLVGAFLAFKDGRFLSWPPAFWYAIGNQSSYESAKWLSWGFAKRQIKWNAQWFWWYLSLRWLRNADKTTYGGYGGEWRNQVAPIEDKVAVPKDDESVDGIERQDAVSVLTDEAQDTPLEAAEQSEG